MESKIRPLLTATASFNEKQLHITHLTPPSTDDGTDIIQGLTSTSKTLPTHYLYDDRGSELFERICELPEYYLTRTETDILSKYANDIAAITGPCEIVELGSGSSVKTRLLLNAYQEQGLPLKYCPIDVSAGVLEASARDLIRSYPDIKIHGLVGTYNHAFEHLLPSSLPQRMIVFIGSSLGNFRAQDCEGFLQNIADALRPGDYFLVGLDLHKDVAQLEAAYNDERGVTAEFSINILSHLNKRYDGNFDPTRFLHWSYYNESKRQIETYLRSLSTQTINLQKLALTVELGAEETILIEISRKFDLESVQAQLQTKKLQCLKVWTDSNRWFSVLLCQRQK